MKIPEGNENGQHGKEKFIRDYPVGQTLIKKITDNNISKKNNCIRYLAIQRLSEIYYFQKE